MRYGSVCSGIEAASVAWRPLGWECAFVSEIDRFPAAVLKERFPEVPNLGDFSKINRGDYKGDIDLLVGGTPCFPAGEMVLSETGYRPIEEIKVGERVMSHMGRLCRVVKVGSKTADDVCEVKILGRPAVRVTANHPFLVSGSRLTETHGVVLDGTPEWREIGACEGMYAAVRRRMCSAPMPEIPRIYEASIPDFLELCGWYVGDGYVRTFKEADKACVILCLNAEKAEKLRSRLGNAVHFTFGKPDRNGVMKVQIACTALAAFVTEHFGKLAHGKRIPAWMYGIPDAWVGRFLDGYKATDGSLVGTTISATTVSKALAYGLADLLVRSTVTRSEGRQRCVIQGRTVNCHPFYSVRKCATTKAWHDGGDWDFVKVKSVRPTGVPETVYNLEVEDDHSYVCDGYCVHNCQAFSVAGLRKGLRDERGNLALEFTKLAYRTRARWLVWENVPGVLSSKRGEDFATFLSMLVGWEVTVPGGKWRNSGLITGAPGCYSVGWRVLDAQYTRVQQFPRAIPQRRRRVILVGSLGPWEDCAKVLFDGEMCGGDAPPRREARQNASGDAGQGLEGAGWDFSWWDGGQRASTLTTRSIGQMMPDKAQLPCVIDTRWHTCAEDGSCPSLLATDYKEPKAVCDPCPTLDASYPGKRNNQDVTKLVCYENHGQDSRIRETGEVAPSIPAQAGTGGNNLPLVQKVFAIDSLASNSMKSANPHSGCREIDVAKTLDTTNPSPSKNQGGMAIVEEAVSIAENVIGRKVENGGNGVGAKEGVCYTLDTVGVHGVCYPIDMMNVDGRGDNFKAKCYGKAGSAAYSLTRRRPSGVCLPGVVRRLVPVECERLMGFPDFWTRIPWRGKPAELCPDGPRYKALGNSMCTNVMAWIGERIQAVEKEKNDGR